MQKERTKKERKTHQKGDTKTETSLDQTIERKHTIKMKLNTRTANHITKALYIEVSEQQNLTETTIPAIENIIEKRNKNQHTQITGNGGELDQNFDKVRRRQHCMIGKKGEKTKNKPFSFFHQE